MKIIRKSLIIYCSVFLLVCNSFAQKNSLNVTYIANEGFMIESASNKILIDAIFYNEAIDFCDVPSKPVLSKIQNAQAPFHDVDVLFVTHYHLDHFNTQYIYQHLISNTKVKLVCPEQVLEKIKNECEEFSKINKRIISYTPELFSSKDIIVNDIKIKMLRLKHSQYMETDEVTGEVLDRHRNVENIGYLIELDGRKILHVGDASLKDNINGFIPVKTSVDLAFIERWEISQDSESILSEYFNPKKKIYMHFAKEGRTNQEEMVRTYVPEGIIFSREMEQKTFYN